MILTMDDYKQMRRGYGDGKSQRAVADETGHSRNTVKKYWKGDAIPHERKPYSPRASPVMTDEMVGYIQGYMQEDVEEGLPKQSHTSRRIFERLRDEHGYAGGESTVRRKVHELKNSQPKAFIPLEFGPGEAMQVDWGQAYFYIRDVRELLNYFCARLCYSRKFFVVAYRHQDEESFLEAFVRTFDEFGGVPGKVIFDNAKVAVKKGFGAHAVTQAQYGLLSAHYGFEPVFCNPRQGHEKGLVEELVKEARRKFMVPVPRVDSLAALNAQLAGKCRAHDSRRIAGRPDTAGAMFEKEKPMLRALPGRPREIARCVSARELHFDGEVQEEPVFGALHVRRPHRGDQGIPREGGGLLQERADRQPRQAARQRRGVLRACPLHAAAEGEAPGSAQRRSGQAEPCQRGVRGAEGKLPQSGQGVRNPLPRRGG